MDTFQDGHLMAPDLMANTKSMHGHGTGSNYLIMAVATAQELADTEANVDQTSEAPTPQLIPLICSICPKNTQFSDVSHLLTHIASKGHLSNMFKLDIAKYTDDEAREKLEEYQSWFDEYNIRELLQSRSENRIQKGASGRGRGGSQTCTTSVSLRGGHGSMVSRNNTKKSFVKRGKRVGSLHRGVGSIMSNQWDRLPGESEQQVRGNSRSTTHLDPVKCKPEDDFDSVSPFTSSSHTHVQQPWPQNHGAQAWSNVPIWNGAYYEYGYQQDFGYGNGQPDKDAAANDEEDVEVSSKYEPSDFEDEVDTSLLPSEDTMDTTVHEPDLPTVPEPLDDEERERVHFRKYLKGDISRLEGVGGFDAAPEEQRRKRNQKKDPSVLVHMEASSRAVRTLEQVTDLNFSHIRWRDVYDEPSIDGSEDEDNEPKPAKKPKRRSPRKTRGRVGRPKAIKVEETTSRESSFAPPTRGSRRGRAARTVRQAPSRSAASSSVSMRESSQTSDTITKSARSTHASMITASSDVRHGQLGPGHVRVGNRVVDVFRDSTDSLPREDSNGAPAPQRQYELPIWSLNAQLTFQRQDGLPGLTLRPGNTNLSLMSPTPMLKRHTSARLFPGKENGHLSFQGPSGTSNPYLNSLDPHSFNPLCMPSQESPLVQGYSLWDGDKKPLTNSFQPINDQPGFNSLHFPSHNEDYQSGRTSEWKNL